MVLTGICMMSIMMLQTATVQAETRCCAMMYGSFDPEQVSGAPGSSFNEPDATKHPSCGYSGLFDAECKVDQLSAVGDCGSLNTDGGKVCPST